MRNNNNKDSRSNVNKHELVYGESSSNARDATMSVYHLCYCLQSLLLLLRHATDGCCVTDLAAEVLDQNCLLQEFNNL